MDADGQQLRTLGYPDGPTSGATTTGWSYYGYWNPTP